MMYQKKYLSLKRILFILCFCGISLSSLSQQPEWSEIAPGIWKAVLGSPEDFDLLKAAGTIPNTEGLEKMGNADFPFDARDIHWQVTDGKTFLRFPLEREEQLYGFGLNFKTVHQRGRILRLHVDHYGGSDDGRTHAPAPFYISSKG